MKWVFDWKCSLYSLTVCLDSMSPFPLFLSYLLSFFSHILHQWYFLYLRITGQNKTQTNPSPIPLQLGSLERRRYNTVGVEEEKQQHINIFVDDSHCFSGETTCSVRWETGNMQGFHLDLTYSGGGAWQHFSGGVYSVDSSSMFISVHVGATSDLLCAREGKNKQHSYDGQSTVLALYNHDHSECQ